MGRQETRRDGLAARSDFREVISSMKPIPIGAKGSYARTVAAADLASHLDASLAAVLSTPTMVAMMEQAAINAIQPFSRRRRKFGRHDDRSQSHRRDPAWPSRSRRG